MQIIGPPTNAKVGRKVVAARATISLQVIGPTTKAKVRTKDPLAKSVEKGYLTACTDTFFKF